MGEEPMNSPAEDPRSQTPEQVMAALSKGFDEQINAYGQLLELSRQEAASIETGDIDALNDLLTRKQAVVADITRRDVALAPVKERWEAVRTQLSEDRKSGLQDRADELKTLLQELLAVEKKNETALVSQRDDINEKLSQLRARKTAHGAYQQNAPQSPRFFDKRK